MFCDFSWGSLLRIFSGSDFSWAAAFFISFSAFWHFLKVKCVMKSDSRAVYRVMALDSVCVRACVCVCVSHIKMCYDLREHLVRVSVCFLSKSFFGSTRTEFGSIWCIISSNKGRIQHVHTFVLWPWVVCSLDGSKSPKSWEEKSRGCNLQDAIENQWDDSWEICWWVGFHKHPNIPRCLVY